MEKNKAIEKSFNKYPDVMSAKEAASMLGIGMNSIYTLLKQKKIKSVTIGRKKLLVKQNVIDYLLDGELVN